ncbi:MAG: hypothetical protein ABSA45_06075 [Verrucomicrobiota bacterium]|jgi:hypothetical protein
MAARAQVTSVEAVESFRANLIVFLKSARAALEEACDEILRARAWVQDDRRLVWEHEMRIRGRKLEEARSELFNSRLSQFQGSAALSLMSVQRAERAIREGEAKLSVIKKWGRELENQTDPLLKQLNQLQGFLTTDMARAVAYLAQVVKTLEAYASVAAPGASLPPVGVEGKPDAGEEGRP